MHLHHAPPDVHNHQDNDHDRQIRVVARGWTVNRVDMAAREVADAGPHQHPECGAECIEDEKPRPAHAGRPGDDAVRLTQALDEPRDHDDLATVTVKEARGFVESLRREKDVAVVALDEGTPADVAEGKPDVVAQNCAAEAEERHEHDAQLPGARIHGSENERGLARNGHPEVLDEDQTQHGQVAELIESRLEAVEHPRQVLGHGGSIHAVLPSHELLAAVDVVCRTREGSVGHDVNCQRGDIGRSDHPTDGERAPQLLAPSLESLRGEVRRGQWGVDEAGGDQVDPDRGEL